MLKHLNRITLNWHLEKDCNYKCKFCYAHFSKIKTNLNLYDIIIEHSPGIEVLV